LVSGLVAVVVVVVVEGQQLTRDLLCLALLFVVQYPLSSIMEQQSVVEPDAQQASAAEVQMAAMQAAHEAALQQQQQAAAAALVQQQQLLSAAQQEILALRAQLATAASNAISSSSSLSSPSSSLAQPSSSGASRGLVRDLKPLKPSTFTGAAGANAEQWLLEMERYFQAADVPSLGRVLFASTFLKESASAWFNSLWTEADREQRVQTCTWAEFKEMFRARFRPLAASRTARSILRNLKQKYRVSSYTDAFLKQVQLIPDMSMADQVDSYINGLQGRIAEEVDREDPSTLVEAMNLAQRAETRQASRRGQPPYGAQSMGGMFQAGPDRRVEPDDRMDLSILEQDQERTAEVLQSECEETEDRHSLRAMQEQRRVTPRRPFASARVPNLTREEFDRLSREGRCFSCRQTGHLARNCQKAKVVASPAKSGN
jgi:hypothetical protein